MINREELVRYIKASKNHKVLSSQLAGFDRLRIGTYTLTVSDTSVVIRHYGMVMYLSIKDISCIHGLTKYKMINGKTYHYEGITIYIGDFSELPIIARSK